MRVTRPFPLGSLKLDHLRQNPNLSLLWHFPETGEQVIAQARATMSVVGTLRSVRLNNPLQCFAVFCCFG